MNPRREPLTGPEDIEYVPRATQTTPDAVCWIWAAIPPHEGRIDIARVAAAVDRSPSTVRRWVRAAANRPLDDRVMAILRMRANLRGHGDYLWPPLNPEAEDAVAALRRKAEWRLEVLDSGAAPATWDERILKPHRVYLYYHPGARVFGVATANENSRATWSNLRNAGVDPEPIQVITVPTKIHAAILKYDALDLVREYRCLPPRAMVPSGRTETWRRRAGDVDLRAVAASRTPSRAAQR